MKKALMYIISVAFLLSTIVFAADKPASNVTKSAVNPVKAAKMNVTGKVIEISDKTIKIERTVKNNTEVMEFILCKPVEDIAVNDAVKIAYVEQDGDLLASRVVKKIPKKAELKETVKRLANDKKQ